MRLVNALTFFLLQFRLKDVICGVLDEDDSVDTSSSQVLYSSILEDASQFKRPEPPPKYFGIDIDGTFYTENEEGWKKNIEAFAKVREMGYVPFICTGRTLAGSARILKELEARTGYKGYPGVYLNGSIVYDENGEIIYASLFPRDFIKALCDCITDGAAANCFVFYTKYDYYSLKPVYGTLRAFLKSRGLIYRPKETETACILTLPIIAISVCCKKFRICNYKEGYHYVCKTARSGLCNINPYGVTKSRGLAKLMENYNIHTKDCAFIGNGENDVEAMDRSDWAFAVGDSPNFVKKHAKFVLKKGYNEAAVAEALELVYGFSIEEQPACNTVEPV